MELLNKINSGYWGEIITTLIIVAALLVLQRIALRLVEKTQWSSERMHSKVYTIVRNSFLGVILITMIVMWIPQIQAFALSVAAIAVAIAVSTKEMITMFFGGIVRSSADLLKIGDRIEINHLKGDVVRVGFLTTEIVEVDETGQRTGNVIHIPNSFFFQYAVVNENVASDYTFHVINIPLPSGLYSNTLMASMLDYVKGISADYIEQAHENLKKHYQRNALSSLSIDPRVLVVPVSHEEYKLVIRLPVKVTEKVAIEQKIIQKVFELAEG